MRKSIALLVGVVMTVLVALQAPASATDGSTLTVTGESSAYSAHKWVGELVESWTIKHTAHQKKFIKAGRCIWSNGWNYYSRSDLSKGRHWDTHMRLCRDKKSPTGWAKVGGGKSGLPCWNPATPAGHHPLIRVPVIPGTITETSTFARFFGSLTAYAYVYFNIHKVCGSDVIDFVASAKGTATASDMLKLMVKAKGTFTSFAASLKTAFAASASASSSINATITCSNTPPPPPPTPAYSCDTLHVAKGDNRTVTIDTFLTSQNNAAYKNAVINWGDGTSESFNSPVGKTHTYGANGTYTIVATAHFDVNGADKSATSTGCQQAVTFSTPPPEKPTVQIGDKNQVDAGDTATVCADYNVPGSDQGTLKFTSVRGAYPGGTSFPVTGQGTKCTIYRAPMDQDQPPSDTLTASLRDETTGLSATPSSTTIAIHYVGTPL